MIRLTYPLFIISIFTISYACNNEQMDEQLREDNQIKPSDIQEVAEVETQIESPENWDEILSAFIDKDSEALRSFCSEKIDSTRLLELTDRVFQNDINESFRHTSFDNLTPIGRGGDEVFAYYFNENYEINGSRYGHEVEIYFKLLDEGLCIWNFMVAN